MIRRLLPVVVAGLVVSCLVVGVAAAGWLFGPSGEIADTPPLGATFSAADRRALDAPTVGRGAEPPPVDPSVDLTDPEAVTRAYLVAAHTVEPGDAGHTHLRAAGYAVPGSPPATVGVLVLDPPPPGARRRASVRELELVATDPPDRRRAYLASVETATGPPGAAADVELVIGHIVAVHQPDGRWLVGADSADNPDFP